MLARWRVSAAMPLVNPGMMRHACLMSDSVDSAPDSPTKPKPDRSLLVVLIIVAVLVVAALVAVFARGGSQQLDPATPEGVVQTYAKAVMEGELETARNLMAMTHTSVGCEPISAFVSSGTRLTLVNSRVNDENAVVTVTINDGYSGPFGVSSGYEDQFELVRSGAGEWWITYTPWTFQVCMEQGAAE